MVGNWTVDISNKAEKQMVALKKERLKVYKLAVALIKELEVGGPIRKEWPHFSRLSKSGSVPDGSYHCHLKEGKPTFVACWRVVNKTIKSIEVYYVGTHENAPY